VSIFSLSRPLMVFRCQLWLAILAILTVPLAAPVAAEDRIEAKVSKVLDGDTFTLSGQSRRIRVWGLDAPEWDHRGGPQATAALKKLISGRRLRCGVLDVDRYGRLVAQCFLPDGRDIAWAMIHAGVAAEYCRYSRGQYGTC
jgi:micrococcal nuclease